MLYEYLENMERHQSNNGSTQYHQILAILAKLKRNAMGEFKKLLLWAMDVACKKLSETPRRFYFPEFGCSFLFLPLNEKSADQRIMLLDRYTLLCKYDRKSRKCLGIGVSSRNAENFELHWILLDGEWENNDELNQFLGENPDLFHKSKVVQMGTYHLTE